MIMSVESDNSSKNGSDQRCGVDQKYEAAITNFQIGLEECKTEQSRIRMVIDNIAVDSENTKKIASDAFRHAYGDGYRWDEDECTRVKSIQGQIRMVQLEKDAVFELWQKALEAIDILESKLEGKRRESRRTKCECRIDDVKSTYPEAMEVLETKLLEARNSLEKQRMLWQSEREKFGTLKNKNTELERILKNARSEISSRDEINQHIIEKLNSDLDYTKNELAIIHTSNRKLENELLEMRCFTSRIVANDFELREKVAEAIELVETAMREKDIILHREATVINEKMKLEGRLINLSDEFVARLEKELGELRDNFNKRTENYLTEIGELKSELYNKELEMDRIQHQCRLLMSCLVEVRHGTEHKMRCPDAKVVKLEHNIQNPKFEFKIHEEVLKHEFDKKCYKNKKKVSAPEWELVPAHYLPQKDQDYETKRGDNGMERRDQGIVNSVDQCPHSEKCSIYPFVERGCARNDVPSLLIAPDCGVAQWDGELETHIESSKKESIKRCRQIVGGNDTDWPNADDRLMPLEMMQRQYEDRIGKLTRYVRVHQKISAKWKDEAQLLISKFDQRSKNLRLKVVTLMEENAILNKELASSQQKV